MNKIVEVYTWTNKLYFQVNFKARKKDDVVVTVTFKSFVYTYAIAYNKIFWFVLCVPLELYIYRKNHRMLISKPTDWLSVYLIFPNIFQKFLLSDWKCVSDFFQMDFKKNLEFTLICDFWELSMTLNCKWITIQ